MADEKNRKVGGRGTFQLGRQYPEVGEDLGRLYEAKHSGTGRTSLVLVPGEGVAWQPEGFWRLSLSCHPTPPTVSLEVERAPASVSVKELANILVLMSAAVERVDDNPEAHAHLVRGVVHSRDPWRTRSQRALASLGMRALVGLSALALGLGLWLSFSGAPGRDVAPGDALSEAQQEGEVDAWPTDGQLDALPSASNTTPQPVRNQKRAPCAHGLELEIAGACWVPVEQRPCPRQTISYEGRCLLPVARLRPEPTSVEGAPSER